MIIRYRGKQRDDPIESEVDCNFWNCIFQNCRKIGSLIFSNAHAIVIGKLENANHSGFPSMSKYVFKYDEATEMHSRCEMFTLRGLLTTEYNVRESQNQLKAELVNFMGKIHTPNIM